MSSVRGGGVFVGCSHATPGLVLRGSNFRELGGRCWGAPRCRGGEDFTSAAGGPFAVRSVGLSRANRAAWNARCGPNWCVVSLPTALIEGPGELLASRCRLSRREPRDWWPDPRGCVDCWRFDCRRPPSDRELFARTTPRVSWFRAVQQRLAADETSLRSASPLKPDTLGGRECERYSK